MLQMRRLLYVQASVLALIAVLFHYFGLHLGFFFTVWWWDILVHFLGGLWVALAGVWLLRLLGLRAPLLLQCLLLSFCVGVAWEVFEFVIGSYGSPFMSPALDTAKDLINDTLGGVLAAYIARELLDS